MLRCRGLTPASSQAHTATHSLPHQGRQAVYLKTMERMKMNLFFNFFYQEAQNNSNLECLLNV